jgi:hypothetical protein
MDRLLIHKKPSVVCREIKQCTQDRNLRQGQ